MVDYRALFKKRRKEKGLTQTQLGEMVDRTQAGRLARPACGLRSD